MKEPLLETKEIGNIDTLSLFKKIDYLQNQIERYERYTKTLEKSLEVSRKMTAKFFEKKSNDEVIKQLRSELLYYQKSVSQYNQQVRELNDKILIQTQIRNVEKLESLGIIRDLQLHINDLRLWLKDKEKQYTVVVSRLKKYEEIKELMVEQKIQMYENKIKIVDKDKNSYINELVNEIAKYKKIMKEKAPELDQKLRLLTETLHENNYQKFRHEFIKIKPTPSEVTLDSSRTSRMRRSRSCASAKSKSENQYDGSQAKNKIMDKFQFKKNTTSEVTNKELIKQLKRCLLSNRILENALNQSTERNEELLVYNQILVDRNEALNARLHQQKQKEPKLTKQLKKFKLFSKSKAHENPFKLKDDELLENYMRGYEQKAIESYFKSLRSTDYEVNIRQLENDVKKMSEFLFLSVYKQEGKQRSKKGSIRAVSAERVHPSISRNCKEKKITNLKLEESDYEIIEY